MKARLVPVVYDWYRAGLQGTRAQAEPWPAELRAKTFSQTKQNFLDYAQREFPDEVDVDMLEKMMMVFIENHMPFGMNFKLAKLGSIPILNVHAPHDPTGSKITLGGLASNVVKERELPYPADPPHTGSIMASWPQTVRSHMMCIMQKDFQRELVKEMDSFLLLVDEGKVTR